MRPSSRRTGASGRWAALAILLLIAVVHGQDSILQPEVANEAHVPESEQPATADQTVSAKDEVPAAVDTTTAEPAAVEGTVTDPMAANPVGAASAPAEEEKEQQVQVAQETPPDAATEGTEASPVAATEGGKQDTFLIAPSKQGGISVAAETEKDKLEEKGPKVESLQTLQTDDPSDAVVSADKQENGPPPGLKCYSYPSDTITPKLRPGLPNCEDVSGNPPDVPCKQTCDTSSSADWKCANIEITGVGPTTFSGGCNALDCGGPVTCCTTDFCNTYFSKEVNGAAHASYAFATLAAVVVSLYGSF